MSLLPFDLTEVIHTELMRRRRPNDGLLHASAHLIGSLRHAQLDVAGAPKVRPDLVREMALWIGTLIHEDIHLMLRQLGIPYIAEVNLTPWLPSNWGGTADGVVWNPDLKAFVLLDLKTQKGEGMRYIVRDGAKEEHRYQVSAYWHALRKMGLPLAKATAVYYLPKNETRSRDDVVEPVLVDFEPVPAKELHALMRQRRDRVGEYLTDLDHYTSGRFSQGVPPERVEGWLRDSLEPVQPRQQRVYFDRKTETHELKLVPHWSADYCPYAEELCSCSTQGTTKVGFFDIDGTYYPRKGYEDIEPEVFPV